MTDRSRLHRVIPLIAFASLWSWSGMAPAEPEAAVTVSPVARQEMKESIIVYGRVQPDPDQVISVTLPRAGLVSRLWVRLGQRVAAGDPMLELDTAPTARMDYQQAQAAVDFARNELQRLRQLLSEQLTTQDQVAGAERNLRDAEAKLEAERKLGTDIGREVVRSPFAGVVTQINISQGQRVQADSPALLLASGEALVVLLGVETEDVGHVEPGMPVTLTSVLQPDIRIAAQVSTVHAMIDPSTRLVDVLVRIPPEVSGALVLDSMMRGEIPLREENSLAVPRNAVLRDDQGAYVFVVRNGTAHRVAVETGLEQGSLIAINGDIAEGDPVVTSGNYELTDGGKVRVAHP